MKERSLQQSNSEIRNTWYPRFHVAGAFAFTGLYSNLRLDELLATLGVEPSSPIAGMLSEVEKWVLIISCLAGVSIAIYARSQIEEGLNLFEFPFTADDFRLRYYKPYLFTIGIVLISEVIIGL